ncbi:MAG TPA: MFS transporter, partial [Gemmatimonadaceae bacterium]|nr:MFS transporter [Gemmatimonadaceae bacterium]
SWFILRPMRDALGVAAGVSKLPYLFLGTLTATLVCQPPFAALVRRFPAQRFITISYRFFLANLLAFYALSRWLPPGNERWLGPVFFVWTSVFTLFVVSVFWGFMADVFDAEQAKRLFGLVSVGGTVGAIAGAAITATLAERLGTVNLLLVSAALLELAVQCVRRFPKRGEPGGLARRRSLGADARPVGGGLWNGFTHVARSPYFLAICAYFVLYTVGSTFLYFQQADIVGHTYTGRAAQTAVLAKIDFASQLVSMIAQALLTGRVMRRVGVGPTLAILPATSVLGFLWLGFVPTLAVLATFTVIRKATNYAFTNPATEVLYTVVSREDKYKAKSFIDTFVYRAGDQTGAWSYAGLATLGLSGAALAFVSAPLSAVLLGIGLWLGVRETALARARGLRGDGEPTSPAPPTATPSARADAPAA